MLELGAGDAGRDRLRLGRLELGRGLRDRGLVGRAAAILVLGDAQRLGIGRRRGVEQPLQLVGDAQLQIVAGERALRREPRIGEIGGARLGGGDIGLDLRRTCPQKSGVQLAATWSLKKLPIRPWLVPTKVDEPVPLEALPPLSERWAWKFAVPVGKNPARASATISSDWRSAAAAALRFWFEMSIRRSNPSSTGSL